MKIWPDTDLVFFCCMFVWNMWVVASCLLVFGVVFCKWFVASCF